MPRRPPAGGRTVSRPAPKVTTPEAVAAAGGEATDDERGALGHVGLAPVGRPEVHRRGVVEQEPGRQLAVRHVLADLRDASVRAVAFQSIRRTSSPGSYGRMRSSSRPVAAAAAAVVAAHLATDPAGQGQLELADEAGRRSGPGPGRAGVRPARRAGRGRPTRVEA